MAKQICYLCGREAAGFASIWTAVDGERWYCHGDDDETTCYMIETSTVEEAFWVNDRG